MTCMRMLSALSKFGLAAALLAPLAALAQGPVVGGPLYGCSGVTSALSAWNSSTSSSATQALTSTPVAGAVLMQLDQTTTLTGGVATVKGTYDGTNYVSVPSAWVTDPRTGAQAGNPYTFVASTNQPILIQPNGMVALEIVLTTTISGSGSVTPYVTLDCNALPPAPNWPQPRSYSASATVSSASSATDIAVLPGNATDTVLVYDMHVTCTQTTAGIVTLEIIKRSAADSGGTSSAMTAVPDDATFAAASSAPLTYTANPSSLGSSVGNLDVEQIGCMATGTTSPNDIYMPIDWKIKPIVLHGTAQEIAVNLNSTTVSGGSFAVTFKWMELP
jgi:hypothetical protein